jgi:hypothetical protein
MSFLWMSLYEWVNGVSRQLKVLLFRVKGKGTPNTLENPRGRGGI